MPATSAGMTAEIVVPIALQSLRLDLGGLDQLAAHRDAVADDLGGPLGTAACGKAVADALG